MMENNISNDAIPLKIISLDAGQQYFKKNNKIKAFKNQNSAFVAFLKFRKINKEETSTSDYYQSASLKNNYKQSQDIRYKTIYSKKKKSSFKSLTLSENKQHFKQNPEAYNKNKISLNQQKVTIRPKSSISKSNSQPKTAIVKNYFPLRKAKKNKDSRWHTYFSSKQINDISLQIQNKKEKQKQKQRQKYWRVTNWTRDNQVKTEFKPYQTQYSQFQRYKNSLKHNQNSERILNTQLDLWNNRLKNKKQRLNRQMEMNSIRRKNN